jgi:ABC-2 type transport system ATP-binding protein
MELSRRFGRLEAVDRLTFEVPQGAIFALVGPNGAGKTTTIQLLMNILRATRGHAEVLGRDTRKLGPAQFARIGYVSENQDLPGWMTVGYFMRYLAPFYPEWDEAYAQRLLRQFDLPLDRKLSQLSRGMRMKAALASSLAYRPSLIVLDEPFSGLDSLVRDELIQGLLESAANATVLISSHDLAEIESFASHIGFLDRGRMHFSEETSALADRFREVEVRLDQPPAIPAAWPSEWLSVETSPSVLRFVDSHYDAANTKARIQALFPEAHEISVRPMPLRSIFVSLAKSLRKAA